MADRTGTWVRVATRPATRWIAGLAVAALALAGLAVAVATRGGGWAQRCVTTGAVIECAPADRPAAPAISGELLDGDRYDLADDRGKVVVINFWGSWCPPCRAEADDLEATYRATRADGVAFLGINVQDGRDKARAFEAGRVSYPSIFDPASRLALDFEVPPNTIPATIVLDRQGRVAAVIRAAVRQADLQPIVTRVAAETPPAGSP